MHSRGPSQKTCADSQRGPSIVQCDIRTVMPTLRSVARRIVGPEWRRWLVRHENAMGPRRQRDRGRCFATLTAWPSATAIPPKTPMQPEMLSHVSVQAPVSRVG